VSRGAGAGGAAAEGGAGGYMMGSRAERGQAVGVNFR